MRAFALVILLSATPLLASITRVSRGFHCPAFLGGFPMRSLSVLLLLACSLSAAAEPIVAVVPNGVTDGCWLLVLKGGVATLQSAQLVGAPVVPPTPTPTPTPTPDVLTARAKAIKAAADKVSDPNREETAANLAGLWELIRQQVVAGKITGQATIAKAIDLGNGMVLGTNLAKAWKPVTDLFAQQWNAQVQDNSGDAALSGYLGEAVSGLKASAPSYSVEPPKLIEKDGQLQLPPDYKAEAGGLKAINWENLLKIIMMIMQLIGPFLS